MDLTRADMQEGAWATGVVNEVDGSCSLAVADQSELVEVKSVWAQELGGRQAVAQLLPREDLQPPTGSSWIAVAPLDNRGLSVLP